VTLKAALGEGLVARELRDSFPPVPLYALTGRGRRLAESVMGSV